MSEAAARRDFARLTACSVSLVGERRIGRQGSDPCHNHLKNNHLDTYTVLLYILSECWNADL
jgi:hypothetical protein